jgi:hypothetical protein
LSGILPRSQGKINRPTSSLSSRHSTLSFIHNLSVGSPPRPIFLTPTSTHPLQSSFPLEAPLNGANGTQTGSLCYINAVASSLQVHGDSSRDGSGRSLDSPEGQCSIGFQPVFCSQIERCSTLLARFNCWSHLQGINHPELSSLNVQTAGCTSSKGAIRTALANNRFGLTSVLAFSRI